MQQSVIYVKDYITKTAALLPPLAAAGTGSTDWLWSSYPTQRPRHNKLPMMHLRPSLIAAQLLHATDNRTGSLCNKPLSIVVFNIDHHRCAEYARRHLFVAERRVNQPTQTNETIYTTQQLMRQFFCQRVKEMAFLFENSRFVQGTNNVSITLAHRLCRLSLTGLQYIMTSASDRWL